MLCTYEGLSESACHGLCSCPLDEMSSLQTMKRICSKVDEMRKQRVSLENELRDLIQKDDITAILVTTERSEIKV